MTYLAHVHFPRRTLSILTKTSTLLQHSQQVPRGFFFAICPSDTLRGGVDFGLVRSSRITWSLGQPWLREPRSFGSQGSSDDKPGAGFQDTFQGPGRLLASKPSAPKAAPALIDF